MNFKLERKLKPKNDKMASEINETAKVAAFVFVFLIMVTSFGNLYTPTIVACIGVGLGLMYLNHKLDFNFFSGAALLIGWIIFTSYAVGLPKCANEADVRLLRSNDELRDLPQWSPDLSSEIMESFKAGDQLLVFDYERYGSLPTELENLDHSKVRIRYRYKLSDYEEMERHKEHNFKVCKSSQSFLNILQY
jgi:hypothetical protein